MELTWESETDRCLQKDEMMGRGDQPGLYATPSSEQFEALTPARQLTILRILRTRTHMLAIASLNKLIDDAKPLATVHDAIQELGR
eukprot:scaffold2593_cov439-Pinguiococcus_pyrenoidosus.AAC.1